MWLRMRVISANSDADILRALGHLDVASFSIAST